MKMKRVGKHTSEKLREELVLRDKDISTPPAGKSRVGSMLI